MYYLGILLEGLRKTTKKNFRQHSQNTVKTQI